MHHIQTDILRSIALRSAFSPSSFISLYLFAFAFCLPCDVVRCVETQLADRAERMWGQNKMHKMTGIARCNAWNQYCFIQASWVFFSSLDYFHAVCLHFSFRLLGFFEWEFLGLFECRSFQWMRIESNTKNTDTPDWGNNRNRCICTLRTGWMNSKRMTHFYIGRSNYRMEYSLRKVLSGRAMHRWAAQLLFWSTFPMNSNEMHASATA